MGLQTYLPVEILDYVQTHEPSGEVVYGIGQGELAKALGYHPCSMSRPLADLVGEGLLAVKRARVRDGTRKQLTYRLTPAGAARLKRETRDVPLLSGDVPLPPHPFLGRKEELDLLTEFARSGSVSIVVHGAPGMGKTALVARHLKRSRRGRIPFWFTVRDTSSPRQFVTALSHALSFLGSPQLAYYSQLPRNPVAREVADLTARALGSHRLAAVFDDLQNAGPDLKRFVAEFLAAFGRSADHRFYLVGQDPHPLGLEHDPKDRITVGGLDRAAAHELTDRQGGLAERFEKVYQSTLGSPLLLRLAVSNPELPADAATLPSAVVARISHDELRAILPVALASESLPSHFLAEDLGVPAARLGELGRMGVLQSTLQDRYEVLQVVRTAILGRVSPADEREAHAQLARYYARSHRPEAIRERLLHLVGAEAWKDAAHLLEEQQRAVLRLGYSETLRLALLHLVNALPQSPSKVRVLLVEAALLRHHSDYSEAIATLHRAIAESDEDPRIACEATLAIVDLHIRLTQLELAEKEFQNALKIGAVSRRLGAYFVLTRARVEEGRGQSQSAADDYQEAFGLAKKYRAEDLALESIAAWSRLAELRSGPEAALRLIEEALPDARQAGRVDIVFNLLLIRARAFAEMGRTGHAEAEMESIRAEAESLGYLNQLTYTLSGLAAMAVEQGKWSEATGYAKQASALAERLGNDLVLGHTLALMCTSERRQALAGADRRLLEEARTHGLRSIEVLGRRAPTDSLVLAHGYLCEVYLNQGKRSEAARHYQIALEISDFLKLGWLKARLMEELGKQIQEPEPAEDLNLSPPVPGEAGSS